MESDCGRDNQPYVAIIELVSKEAVGKESNYCGDRPDQEDVAGTPLFDSSPSETSPHGTDGDPTDKTEAENTEQAGGRSQLEDDVVSSKRCLEALSREWMQAYGVNR